MDRAEAARELGVGAQADRQQVRHAYRLLISRHHPDRAGEVATDRAARLNAAYTLLMAEPPAAPDPPTSTPDAGGGGASRSQPGRERRSGTPGTGFDLLPVKVVDGDTMQIEAPAEEAFLAVLEAAHQLGEVTYVDPRLGLLEVVISFLEAPTCSVVVTFQGRNDHTEAFCSIESLSADPPPPLSDVVALLAAAVALGAPSG